MQKYILALDAGTTSNRAILFNHSGQITGVEQQEFKQIFPQPGWVEHDAEEIWITMRQIITNLLDRQGISSSQIAGIGITNQRETTVVWNRETGRPVCNAIVWQDRRTAGICDLIKESGKDKTIKEKTGLVIDAYFSGSKIQWMLENVDGIKEQAVQGKLAFGTIDSWLVWKLSGGAHHLTDVSNASRTMLFNIHTLSWDTELLEIFSIPEKLLPEVKSSSEVYCTTNKEIFGMEVPISGIAGDQQAALFGQMCIEKGMAKNTYGTGCFVMMNTGNEVVQSHHNLLTTVAWKIGEKVQYALEGSIFIGGAVVQWLRDQLNIVQSTQEIEALARSVEDNGGVYFVPAFVGLGAPHWDPYATGTLLGLSRGTTKGHIARAALEAIALQSMDVINAMGDDAGFELAELRVDGGAAANNLLMQIQTDIIGKKVIRPETLETTALGAAYLAGLAVGFWENTEEIKKLWTVEKIFVPEAKSDRMKKLIHNWHKAITRSKGWYEP